MISLARMIHIVPAYNEQSDGHLGQHDTTPFLILYFRRRIGAV